MEGLDLSVEAITSGRKRGDDDLGGGRLGAAAPDAGASASRTPFGAPDTGEGPRASP